MLKKENNKVIYYGYLKNRSIDMTINVNGQDKGSFHISSYKAMKDLYKGDGFKFVKIENDLEEEGN